MNHISFVNDSTKKYHDELNKELSEIDMEICDIMHYVELCEMSEEQSLETMDLLRKCRDRRRDVKDEMQKVEWYQKALGESSITAKVKECVKQIRKLENRKYTPRKLVSLFEDVKKRQKGTESEQKEEEVAKIYEDAESSVIEEICEMQRSEGYMERQETIYDGKENNWLEFAKEQMLFFGNAK